MESRLVNISDVIIPSGEGDRHNRNWRRSLVREMTMMWKTPMVCKYHHLKMLIDNLSIESRFWQPNNVELYVSFRKGLFSHQGFKGQYRIG